MMTEVKEVVEGTVNVFEEAAENVTSTKSGFGKTAAVVGGVISGGILLYEAVKFIKAKKKAKKYHEPAAKDTNIVEADFNSEDEDFEE